MKVIVTHDYRWLSAFSKKHCMTNYWESERTNSVTSAWLLMLTNVVSSCWWMFNLLWLSCRMSTYKAQALPCWWVWARSERQSKARCLCCQLLEEMVHCWSIVIAESIGPQVVHKCLKSIEDLINANELIKIQAIENHGNEFSWWISSDYLDCSGLLQRISASTMIQVSRIKHVQQAMWPKLLQWSFAECPERQVLERSELEWDFLNYRL